MGGVAACSAVFMILSMAEQAGMETRMSPDTARRSRSGRSDASPSMPMAAMAEARSTGEESSSAMVRTAGSAARSPSIPQTCRSAVFVSSEHVGSRSASREAAETFSGGNSGNVRPSVINCHAAEPAPRPPRWFFRASHRASAIDSRDFVSLMRG